jgi:hypothetical protein
LVGSHASTPTLAPAPSRTLVSLTSASASSTTTTPDPGPIVKADAPRGTRPLRRARRGWSSVQRASLGGLAIVALLGGGLLLRRTSSRAAPPKVQPAPARATATKLDTPSVTLPPPTPLEPASTERSAAPIARHRAPAHHPPSVPSTEMGYLTINIEPWGVVYVDGRRFADSPPVYRAPIGVGPHRVKVYSTERKAFSPERKVDVHAGENRVVGFEW